MANHLRLDLNLVELLAGVDTNDASNHLGDDNHVSEVGLDEVGLLVGLGLLLGLSELLDEAHGAALQTAVDPSAGTGVDDISELVRGEVEEAVSGRWSAPLFSLNGGEESCPSRFQVVEKEMVADLVRHCTGWNKATYLSRSIPR